MAARARHRTRDRRSTDGRTAGRPTQTAGHGGTTAVPAVVPTTAAAAVLAVIASVLLPAVAERARARDAVCADTPTDNRLTDGPTDGWTNGGRVGRRRAPVVRRRARLSPGVRRSAPDVYYSTRTLRRGARREVAHRNSGGRTHVP